MMNNLCANHNVHNMSIDEIEKVIYTCTKFSKFFIHDKKKKYEHLFGYRFAKRWLWMSYSVYYQWLL
jgi:hypothetical protein